MEKKQLARRRGLLVSTLSEEMKQLRRYKTLPLVEGVPEGLYSKSRREEDDGNRGRGAGGREHRDKRRQDRRNDEHRQGMTPHDETHPQVMEMMWEYYKLHDCIKARQICYKAGMRLHDLNIGKACLNHILGGCNRERCTDERWHPNAADATPEEVNELCNKLRRGVDEMTRVKRHRGSR